jgi:hypothetical protein
MELEALMCTRLDHAHLDDTGDLFRLRVYSYSASA